jgi:hypothetical protein
MTHPATVGIPNFTINQALLSLLTPICDLQPDPRNARTHDDRNLSAIGASLRRFGQQKPIVVDAGGIVRAGNGLFAAAKSFGWTHIAAVRTNLADAELKAYALADNQTATLAGWDRDTLAALIAELQAEDATLLDAVYAMLLDGIRARGGRYRSFQNHAKVLLLSNAGTGVWISVEGSANLTSNPRLEQYVITNDQGLYDFHRGWMEEAFRASPTGNTEQDRAPGGIGPE